MEVAIFSFDVSCFTRQMPVRQVIDRQE